MYNILIADDETTEREVIRFLLKKDGFPFEVREASNGKNAWELLEKEKFDILFTDIRMPFYDGLELAGRARRLYPDIQIIFFSGYDDFTYVKEALSLHVVNYILKPVNPEEFRATITQVLHSLEEQSALSRNHILYQLINGGSPSVDFSFLRTYHRLLLLQFQRDFWGKEEPDESLGLRQILPQDCDLVNLNPAQSLILFSGQRHHHQWYQQLAGDLTKRLWQKYHIKCFAEISEPFQTPEEIPAAFEKAELLLTERLFFTPNPPESRKSLSVLPENDSNDDMIYRQLQTDIQLKDAEGLIRHMDILLATYKNAKNYSHIYVRFLCTNLLKTLCDGLAGRSEDSFDEYARAIYNLNHFSEIEALLTRLTRRLADILEQEQASPQHAIQLVKQFIRQHYSEDLSLDILSAQIHLTPRYLSALFIKEMGCGINKYIKRVRMKKAMELLLQTNLKVNEIARQVGYTNLSYFCKSFLDDFEVTPEKFRADPGTARNQETLLHDLNI